jgi:hypothetical protein
LYQSERFGASFNYSFPLVNGVYEITLKFAEIHFNSAGNRVLNVAIEGTQLISNLDLLTKVAKNAAYEEHHFVTVSDGQINITFSSSINNAKISAITVERVQHTILSNGINGAVTLNPAGGVYDPETVVTVTATPDSGYSFGSWGGDLAGPINPTTIVIDGDKSVTANFTPTPNPWGEWQAYHFTQTEREDPGLSGEHADFDSDGLVNLLEYAMGLLPKDPATAGLPCMTLTPGIMTLRYRRSVDASDVTLNAEVSENLIDWSASGVTESVIETTGRIQTIEATCNIPTDAERFYGRVRGTK